MQDITRRNWLRLAVMATGAVVVGPMALAQGDGVASAVRAMSPMTGSDLPANRVEPTSGLVGLIVTISKPLREIELGEMEPATFYSAE